MTYKHNLEAESQNLISGNPTLLDFDQDRRGLRGFKYEAQYLMKSRKDRVLEKEG